MYDGMMQEIARQHVQDLYREASVARIAKLAKAQRKARGKPGEPLRAQPKKAMAG